MGRLLPGARPGNVAARSAASGRAFWALLVAGSLSIACSSERTLGDYPPSTCDLEAPPPVFDDVPLVIATFWSADTNERAAFQTLLEHVDSSRYVVTPQQMNTRVDVQRHINDSFDSERLPDVFQVNGGSDVLRWVSNRPSDTTDVCALDPLREQYAWNGAYFPSALAPLSCHGKLYGLPVGIHHLNVLFYNRDVYLKLQQLAKARGVELMRPDQLTSAYELVTQLERIAALGMSAPNGAPLVPLAIGTQNEWPLTIIAFENLLLSLGHDAYETVWAGGLRGDSGALARKTRRTLSEMLSVLRSLIQYSNVSARISWQEAVRQVGTGEALMTVTGDWGWAQLDAQTSASVATTTFPGTAGKFVYTPDSFAVPRELKKDGFPARTFLHDVVANKAALIEFANAKHAIPPRQDLSPTEVATLATDGMRATYEEFARCDAGVDDCKLLLAVSGLGPPPGADPCFDEMDAILAFAVADIPPSHELLSTRHCQAPFPASSAEAQTRLVDLLLGVAQRQFAEDCR